jgi:CheY-like chemotaxis protein
MALGYILLIDDDEVANFVNNLIIQKTKKDISTVSFLTAAEGLNFLIECFARGDELPEYIFLDINMPEMNGWEFLEKYAELDLKIREHVKVFMLSSSQNEEDYETASLNQYVSGFLHKPLLAKDLLGVIDQTV